MQTDRRALYNSLRMNWLWNPSMPSEQWQVEDYRSISTDALFQRLQKHHIFLDKPNFHSLVDSSDSPEDLLETLLADNELDTHLEDQIYLLLFELWRRLSPEKQSLSLFCDELDHQIFLFDNQQLTHAEELQDAIANLKVILDENCDTGVKQATAFETIASGCANDLESFLYDYISVQIDTDNLLYASELIEEFSEYISDRPWFDFLKAQVLSATDPKAANEMIRGLVKKLAKNPDYEFAVEMLAFLSQSGEHDVFQNLLKLTIPLALTEEDFQEILTLSADYFSRLDRDAEEARIQAILQSRQSILPQTKFNPKDSQVTELLKISDSK